MMSPLGKWGLPLQMLFLPHLWSKVTFTTPEKVLSASPKSSAIYSLMSQRLPPQQCLIFCIYCSISLDCCNKVLLNRGTLEIKQLNFRMPNDKWLLSVGRDGRLLAGREGKYFSQICSCELTNLHKGSLFIPTHFPKPHLQALPLKQTKKVNIY